MPAIAMVSILNTVLRLRIRGQEAIAASTPATEARPKKTATNATCLLAKFI